MALQMTWQPSLLHKRKNGPPLGLKNLGNTCYLNSVLQCLTYTPPLANFCLKNQHSSFCDSVTESDRKRDCPFCILEKRIARSLTIDVSLDTPSKINSCLRIFAEHFRFGRQEDAHEFLRYVIDACHNTCLRLKKLQQQRRKVANGSGGGGEGLSGSTVVKEIFGGALQSQVKCLSCGSESNKVDEIMDISLDVVHSSSLKESLHKFFQPEVLDGNNKYKCENCKKLVTARKQMSILQAPNVLVIQLKRFDGIYGGKIDKAIAFEEVLVLSSYICKASQDPHPEYNLFGTIVHSGYSPDSGHYYAYIKDAMSRWYCCNDSCVSLSTIQDVLSEKVYILFFSRTKQRPTATSTVLASNGVKYQERNGSDTAKIQKAANPSKAMHLKIIADNSSENDSFIKSKVGKVPSNQQKKLSSLGNSGTIKFPATINVKVNKIQPNEKNGDVKASICTEEKIEKKMPSLINGNGVSKNKTVDAVDGESSQAFPLAKEKASICTEEKMEKKMPSLINGNGVSKNKTIDAVDGESSQAFPLANGNGKIQSIRFNSVRADLCNGNHARNSLTTEKGPSYHDLQNGGVKCPADISGSKRKLQDENPCILLANDAHSQAKLEELKEVLRTEASLVLRSCGWSDKVSRYMHSRKNVYAEEAGNAASDGNESKRRLITDSKQNFISQIPESLKENLIERLRSFSQEKQCSGP
ncbi:ubiquitin carboxyl-terminal hydrolase 25 [Cornus florida]|uniref:ubiquitin carboxyl-terminal hydrolase 25 n=1 Tax=Cornus florida TaxID=4283 RepID=UPI0028A079C8|nr:ubiquitin carboxyl-terminal hydrolase 25 [Cornus florida]